MIKIGVYLRWRKATGANYTQTEIYRASSEDGNYSLIHTQNYSDTNYYDIDGTTTSWYKIRFVDSVSGKTSDYSDAFQGGTFKGYCNIEDVREITNINSSQVSDANMCVLITRASERINAEIGVYIEEELITYIDGYKENDIDGVNTTFFTYRYPIGDMNNDFQVDTNDLIVYEIDTTVEPPTKTEMNVSSVTPNTGKFVLETAPKKDKEYRVTYEYTQISVSDPHPLISQACMFLAAALAYQKINVGKAPKFKMGSTTINRDMDSFKEFYKRYREIMNDVNDRNIADIKEAPSIPGMDNFNINKTPPSRDKNDQYTRDY